MSEWTELRKDFPITERYTYLDHAAGGPIPNPVLEVIQKFQKENALGADFFWLDWMKKRDESRQRVADFIGADPEEIAFTTSTSHGMNLVAELLAHSGKVLLNESEFPSSTVPWLWRKAKTVFQPADSGKIDPQDLIQLLKPDIKTIVTSYVQYATGYRQDIEQIGKAKEDRFFVVNATQGFGVLPIDVRKWNADFVCTNSYKWMMSGYGGGVLYIRKPLIEMFPPESAGWRSMMGCDLMNNKNLDMKPSGERYELGCPNFASIFGFAEAIGYFTDIGMNNIEKRVLSLTDYLVAQLQKKGIQILSPLDSAKRSGIVVFGASEPVKLWKQLMEKKIFVTPRGGGLRVAPHFYNTEEEIDRLITALPERELS